ncbi:helix-turn-helix domain-containing protein [Ruegeria marisrubri]|uniref:AraC family transcriptional regulator n=1 Tax=Ruegeria marisrubri TaxID=1685379 RepID=UPI001CD3B638|nr:helix-turn-helix domain-containing protein [Ruegeria marisrubri]MCA0905703.1 helix-turn-helix domain-containing protein [Ruegeria marisrubri]
MDIHWQYAVDEVEAVFEPTPDWHSELIQLDAGSLGYRASEVVFPGVAVRYETMAKPLRSFQQMKKKGFFAGFVLAASRPVLWKGREVAGDFALVFGDADHDLVFPAQTVVLTIEVDSQPAQAAGLTGLEPGLWQCDPTEIHAFVDLCNVLTRRQMRMSLGQSEQQNACALVVSRFLAMLIHPTQTQPSRQYRIMSKAEEFAAHLGWCENVAIDNLADAIDVPRRTLHRSFKELYGMGPQGYLRLVRLHIFREALLTGDHTGIADAALSAGFQHFGRAAQYYHKQFGELPKHTLRRSLGS